MFEMLNFCLYYIVAAVPTTVALVCVVMPSFGLQGVSQSVHMLSDDIVVWYML